MKFDCSVIITWREILYCLAFLAALVLTYVIYYPSLYGPFIFDDAPNLKFIGEYGGITTLDNLLIYLLDGKAGPLGRPISLISFLINDNNWPTDPFWFKYTNVLIHCLVGIFVYVISRQIFGKSDVCSETQGEIFSILVMCFWLLHPMNISGVLLVVQRMNQLSTLFVLLFIFVFLIKREKITSFIDHFILSVIYGAVAVLAILSKENGVLLPLYLLLLDRILLKNRFRINDWFGVFCIYIPTALYLIIIIYFSYSSDLAWSMRNYNLPERLMTETRVLWEYVYKILMLSSTGTGVVHDDVVISRSILNPVTTCLSIIAWCLSLYVVFYYGNVLMKLGFLWYLLGHSLESTIIPLEIYFEHRNYLPILGVLFFVFGIISFINNMKITLLFFLPYLVVEVMLSYQSALIWGDRKKMITIYYHEHPDSPRAHHMMINEYIYTGDFKEAKKTAFNSMLKFKEDSYILMQNIILDCFFGVKSLDGKNKFNFEKAKIYSGTMGLLDDLIKLLIQNKCELYTFSELEEIIKQLIYSRDYKENITKSVLYDKIYMIKFYTGKYHEALEKLDMAIKYNYSDLRLHYNRFIIYLFLNKFDDFDVEFDKIDLIDNTNFVRKKIFIKEVKKLKKIRDNLDV
ncbi:hypothetical protein H0A36_06555 [Endozoicomonas sp. SM1973]|uniref:Uncharacterized protein n=1 Tax=Spartinivicinus marinus TaxID=2994442 RepID=A0A853I7X7_9GAMM|nr:hypothetical protein [Spartinivicinus marinus]MCX4028332.1 hypothetical protein [Spartinivicinus marinus]NYZ65667.1 hypothetical protein [Spartinivicinus marinus]